MKYLNPFFAWRRWRLARRSLNCDKGKHVYGNRIGSQWLPHAGTSYIGGGDFPMGCKWCDKKFAYSPGKGMRPYESTARGMLNAAKRISRERPDVKISWEFSQNPPKV